MPRAILSVVWRLMWEDGIRQESSVCWDLDRSRAGTLVAHQLGSGACPAFGRRRHAVRLAG
jgi:hypothetical protein